MSTCEVESCERIAKAKGRCDTHYAQQRRELARPELLPCLDCPEMRARTGRRQSAYCDDCRDRRQQEREKRRYEREGVRSTAEQRYKWALKRYGLTVEDYERLLKEQHGRCASCGDELVGRARVDHDHSCCPGTRSCGLCVRGLLCHHCNVAAGLLHDDLDRVMALAVYLLQHQDVLEVAQ